MTPLRIGETPEHPPSAWRPSTVGQRGPTLAAVAVVGEFAVTEGGGYADGADDSAALAAGGPVATSGG